MLRRFIRDCRVALRGLALRRIDIVCDGIHYNFERVPLKKVWNWLLVELAARRKPDRSWGWPTHLQLEPTNLCNLRCALCPVTEGMGRPSGTMDFAQFERLMDEIGDYLFLILLWDWGEPLVHPEFDRIIAHAKRKGIKVVCSTNGHALADPGKAERLILSGLDTIIFAVDGTSQETYQRYRGGGSLETALRGIRTVVERRNALGSRTPFINFRFIVMEHNECELAGLPEFARSLGVDVLTLKTLNPSFALLNPADADSPFIPADSKYQRFRYTDDGRTRLRRRGNPCKSLWNAPAIHWNGTVCLCSFDSKEKWPLGDFRTASFREIWRGTEYAKARRQFRGDWEALASCKDCSYAYEGGSLACETIAEAIFFHPQG
jgi:radical SAM protein with 4Fe4S-binding SPASM domain